MRFCFFFVLSLIRLSNSLERKRMKKGFKMTRGMFVISSPLLSSSVQYQSSLYGGNNNSSSPLSSRGSSPIMCERCGEVCRGEVVRVKNTHFHVHCFTCQGKKNLLPHILRRLTVQHAQRSILLLFLRLD